MTEPNAENIEVGIAANKALKNVLVGVVVAASRIRYITGSFFNNYIVSE